MFTRRSDSQSGETPMPASPFAAFTSPQEPRTTPPPLGTQPPQRPLAGRPDNQAPGSHASASAPATDSVIGTDLTIEGQSITIRCMGTLQINGNIEAELHSKQLVVGDSGKVQGSITADRVDVWGQVSGAIQGAHVLLHRSAKVDGDIHAASLTMEDGASFEGRSRKATEPGAVAPQLVASSSRSSTSPAEPIPLPLAIRSTT